MKTRESHHRNDDREDHREDDNEGYRENSKTQYEIVPFLKGYIVKCVMGERNFLYRAKDSLWIRYKNNLVPISRRECSSIISECLAEERENRKFFRR